MSLKILHTSDWHLGKIFRATTFDLLAVQDKILIELEEMVKHHEPHVVLIAGDIFDTYNPPFEAERLFYRTISNIADNNSLVIAIAGNHDSPDKLKISEPLISGRHSILIAGKPFDSFNNFRNERVELCSEEDFLKVKLKEEDITLSINVVPYPSEVRMGVSGDDYISKLYAHISREPQFTCDYYIVLSHLFVTGAQKSTSERVFQVGGLESIPSEILPKKANYIALGHLHKYQTMGNATYSGSIYPFDVGEIDDKKGVCLWQGGKIDFIEFENIPKIKKLNFDSFNEAIKNVPSNNELCYLYIKSDSSYSHDEINRLLKVYGDRLISWQFETNFIEPEKKTIDINSLSDKELFIEFYKTKHNNSEPDDDLITLFINSLQEAQDAPH